MRRFVNYFLSMFIASSSVGAIEKYQADFIVDGNNRLSLNLYQQMKVNDENLFFSPYSISSAFAMTAAGAKGMTAREMYDVLQFTDIASPGIGWLNKQLITTTQTKPTSPIVQIANAIWPQKDLGLLPSFKNVVQKDFGGTIDSLDYAHDIAKAVAEVNKWADVNTKGKIQNILSERDVSSDTKLILASAIYMKANWLHMFNEYGTQNAPFHIDKKRTVDTPMMQVTESLSVYDDKDVAVIELPYIHDTQGPALSMVVALPKDIEGLAALEEKLSIQLLGDWLKQARKQKVQLQFPKFKLESRTVINDVMQALGMKLAFTKQADFSGITGRPDLFISSAIHQTYIDVDEKGTEAAAVTVIGMRTTSMEIPVEPYIFTADHPFVFFIIDQRTKAILFMGRFVHPKT